MTEKCEFCENCGFFKNLEKIAEVEAPGWVRSFCGDKEKSDSCLRKEFHKLTGGFPPDNIPPTGKILRQISQPGQSDSA